MHQRKGFSLIELLVVLGMILVILAVAIPIYKNAMDSVHLKEAGRRYAGILQRGKLAAVAGNTYNAIGVQALANSCTEVCVGIAYVDTTDTNNPPTNYAAPEPMAVLGSGVLWGSSGPATNDLNNKVFPSGTLSYPPVFGPRGLPCVPMAVTGGTICNTQGGNVAYATYFQSPLGKWEAVTVNPAGEIQLWSYDPDASAWNQIENIKA